jgi:hypothetical protein
MNMVGWLVARFLYSLFFMGRTTFVCVCVSLSWTSADYISGRGDNEFFVCDI